MDPARGPTMRDPDTKKGERQAVRFPDRVVLGAVGARRALA